MSELTVAMPQAISSGPNGPLTLARRKQRHRKVNVVQTMPITQAIATSAAVLGMLNTNMEAYRNHIRWRVVG